MRILHFLNTPLDVEQFVSGGRGINSNGAWMAMLVGKLLEGGDCRVACASFGAVDSVKKNSIDRLDCFVIPRRGNENTRGLAMCRQLVDAWKPDLVHIHGTEGAFGLLSARHMISCPATISLQGLLGPCSEWYRFFGNRSLRDIARMHWLPELPLLRGMWTHFKSIRENARREREIVEGNRYFMGRTDWDRSYIRALNPSAKYYHAGELLRDPFWRKQWSLEGIQRHRIVFTNAKHPRKGTEVLLDAVKLLAPDYPGIKVGLVGGLSRRTGYGRYLYRKKQALNDVVDDLGPMNAEQVAAELLKAHVFAHPSFIDNSPNSVCEAQLLGMPVIAAYTGGVPSLIEDGRTGLFCPTGDAFMLAAAIRRLFDDDELAVRLGSQAREVAVRRHDPDAITGEILANYEDILRNARSPRSPGAAR